MSAVAPDERRARIAILLGAVGVAAGIASSGSVGQGKGVSGVLLIVGWLTLVVGIHRFGRIGTPRRD
jgi:hypothetical protein